MMGWTDRHCRAFHRVLTGRALLYTEMVTADAVIHGEREQLIGYGEGEQAHKTPAPLAPQRCRRPGQTFELVPGFQT